jgi:hypothetical protein
MLIGLRQPSTPWLRLAPNLTLPLVLASVSLLVNAEGTTQGGSSTATSAPVPSKESHTGGSPLFTVLLFLTYGFILVASVAAIYLGYVHMWKRQPQLHIRSGIRFADGPQQTPSTDLSTADAGHPAEEGLVLEVDNIDPHNTEYII